MRGEKKRSGTKNGEAANFAAFMNTVSESQCAKFPVFLPGVSVLASPLIMFRLKRLGFSNCRVVVDDDGLTVYANR